MNRTAAALWVSTVVLVVASTVLSAGRDETADLVLYATLPLLLVTVGALIAGRQPGNAIGWLFAGLGLYVAAAEAVEGYGFLAADEGLPADWAGRWVMSWTWLGEVLGWVVILLLFPDGRAPRRWSRLAVGAAAVGCLLAFPGLAFGPYLAGQDLVGDSLSADNPWGIDNPVTSVPVVAVGLTMLVAGLVGSVALFVQRLRRSRGAERVQLKWFAYAAALCGLVAPVATLLWQVVPSVHILPAVAFNALPVAAGIAILRHGLYDIDVVINRTLVYGALTATLVGTYLLLVLVLQLGLSPLAGESDLAVAASTLAVAALFRPLRTRIQQLVDRHFYRSRYDAALTLATFSGRLRNELDLETLGTDLRSVVHDTLQPASVSLWLRTTEAGS